MRRTALLLASMGLVVLLACGVVLAAPTSFDASFDGDGKVITDFSPPEDPRDEWTADVVVQPDGKIVTVGSAQTGSYTDFALARYTTDGSLDTAFGTRGKVTTDIVAADQDDYATATFLQSDGKIVVAGYTSHSYNEQFALARYNSDGTLDSTFDGDGKVTANLEGYDDGVATDVAVQPDGKIVVVGYEDDDGSFVTMRYNPDGTLDTSFDQNGKATTSFVGYNSYGAQAVGVQQDGKIVVAGSAAAGNYDDFALVCYNADGTLDTSFDEDGKLVSYITSRDDYASDLEILGNGKIVVAGSANDNAALAKYNTDGTLDTSFGTGGKTLHGDSGGYFYTYNDLVIQPDGKIVAQASYWFSIARHNADGSLDTSLRATRSVGGDTSALALQSDGKVVQAGSIEDNNGFSNFALVRRIGAFQDATKPNGSVTIDGGRRVTKDTTVTLSLNATDPSPGSGVVKMRIKNAGSSWSRWTRYAESKDWRVTRGAGTKTVYVQYRDGADNISASAKDTITYKP